MNIGIFISTLGGSPLLDGLIRGWREGGHLVESFKHAGVYDLIAVFNHCAHDPSYSYPKFPTCKTPIIFIDTAEYGYFRRLPGVANNYQNTFSKSAMMHDTKNLAEQLKLKRFLEGRSFPYFIREYFNFLTFPNCYHPIDYPLYHSSACPEKPDREQYLKRPMDLFTSWGMSHPWRKNLTEVMRASPVKSEVLVLEENGTPRMPQMEFFRRTRDAKCSVSFDGYGSSSFRLTEVLVRSLLLRGPLNIICRRDLTDGVNCIEFGIKSDGENFIETNLGVKIQEAIDDPERSYRIYEAGYHHCNEHYTERATAEYVLRMTKKHDWRKPTPLEL